jgi:hypothetical protein
MNVDCEPGYFCESYHHERGGLRGLETKHPNAGIGFKAAQRRTGHVAPSETFSLD